MKSPLLMEILSLVMEKLLKTIISLDNDDLSE